MLSHWALTDRHLLMHHLSLLAVIARFVVYSLNVYGKINSFTANGLLNQRSTKAQGQTFSYLLVPSRGAREGRGEAGEAAPCPKLPMYLCLHAHAHTGAQVTAAPGPSTSLFVSLP